MKQRALYLYLSYALRLTRGEVRKLPGDIRSVEDLFTLSAESSEAYPAGMRDKLSRLAPSPAAVAEALQTEVEEALALRRIRFLTSRDADWPSRFKTLRIRRFGST